MRTQSTQNWTCSIGRGISLATARGGQIHGTMSSRMSEQVRRSFLIAGTVVHRSTTVAGAVNVILDSVDTLVSDMGSPATTYGFITELLSLVRSKPSTFPTQILLNQRLDHDIDPSRLILHVNSPSPILPLLTQTTLSNSLTHIRAHPPEILTHLATAYLTPPPPASPATKFWSVFIPFSEREYEIDRLVFGRGGEGRAGATKGEAVIEILVRGHSDGGRRRGIDRVLEGWSATLGPCELSELETLKSVWTPATVQVIPPRSSLQSPHRSCSYQVAPDPTQNLPFNLNLTPSQQQSRASLPLPYAHEGERSPSAPLPLYRRPLPELKFFCRRALRKLCAGIFPHSLRA
jgi:elongator complex protein 5